MRLFQGRSRYSDFDKAYDVYLKRSSKSSYVLSKGEFIDIIRRYCKTISTKIEKEGFADFPLGIGSISAVRIRKKPIYNKKECKYIPASSIDWNETRKTGTIVNNNNDITFGICFIPRRIKGLDNFRSIGIVANRQLYRRMKRSFDNDELQFYVPDIEMYL